MTVYAVYIIKDGGITILSETFLSNVDIPSSLLVGGLLGAMQSLSKDALGSEMRSIKTDGIAYHIRSFGSFQIALITDYSIKPDNIIQEIGFRFIKSYGEDLLGRSTRVDIFEPFKNVLREILSNYIDNSKSINPSKVLNTSNVFNLPADLKPIALSLLALGEATINDIANDCELDVIDALEKIYQLQQGGFVGQKLIDNQKIYFCSKM